jgi:hypothetical protein
LVAISAVVNNKLFLDKYLYKLYPNIYVILVGKSGIRKGPPVAAAKALVKEVNNTRVISGRTSIQKCIAELATAFTRPNGGPPIVDAIGALFASEFASFIISDPQALTILTDLYDGHYNPEWENLTNIRGKELLKNPNITLFGASNEVHFKDAVPDNALGGGFVARTFIIYADKKSGVNALTERPEEILDIHKAAEYLKEIAKLRGQFIWTAEGKETYDAWYSQFSNEEYQDTTGTIERLHDHILKTSMLISLSRSTDLRLTREDINEAIFACQDFVPGARRVSMTSGGQSAAAPGTAAFIQELLRRPPEYSWTRTGMAQKHWQYFDVFELDKISESLISAKVITQELRPTGPAGKNELWFILNPKVVERYEKMQKEN